MKRVLSITILFCIFTTISTAQTTIDDYKKIDYISVNDGQMEQFLTLAEELKSSYDKLIQQGVIKSWSLYHTKYPGGEKNNYNFISVVTASDVDTMTNQFSSISTPSFVPSMMKNAKLAGTCTVIKSELWKVENVVDSSDDGSKPSQYVSMDYMQVAAGKGPDYLMLEGEIAKPIHEERIKRNKMAGWHTYSLLAPSGSDYGYNFGTANFFDRLSNIEFGFTTEIINQTMGKNANISELFNTIYNTRDRIRVEIWELYLYAQSSKN